MLRNAALLMVCVVFSARSSDPGTSESTANAHALWDKMIARKGLTSTRVQSFALSLKAVGGSAFANADAGREQRTIVSCLPDKWWVFDDYRPGKLGASARAYDLASGQGWLRFLGDHGLAQKMDPRLRGLRDDRNRILAIFFGQVPGFTPVPVEASRVRKGLDEFDAVTTEWQNETFVYYLDPEDHLPRRLEIVRKGTSNIEASQGRPAKTLPFVSTTQIEMSEYSDVGGIQVPAKVKIRDSSYDVDLQLNVQISDNLFSEPPSTSTDAGSWRRK